MIYFDNEGIVVCNEPCKSGGSFWHPRFHHRHHFSTTIPPPTAFFHHHHNSTTNTIFPPSPQFHHQHHFSLTPFQHSLYFAATVFAPLLYAGVWQSFSRRWGLRLSGRKLTQNAFNHDTSSFPTENISDVFCFFWFLALILGGFLSNDSKQKTIMILPSQGKPASMGPGEEQVHCLSDACARASVEVWVIK